MAQMKLIYTTAAKLEELPISNGQIIYAPDDNIICLDIRNQRFSYKTIRTFGTEAERLAADFTSPGFYYVDETNILWRKTLNDNWRQITSSNINPVVYGETEASFPIVGKEGVLYYTNKNIYNWNTQTQNYNLIANANTWDSIQ